MNIKSQDSQDSIDDIAGIFAKASQDFYTDFIEIVALFLGWRNLLSRFICHTASFTGCQFWGKISRDHIVHIGNYVHVSNFQCRGMNVRLLVTCTISSVKYRIIVILYLDS